MKNQYSVVKTLAITLLSAGLALSASLARAGALGPEFRVNNNATGAQAGWVQQSRSGWGDAAVLWGDSTLGLSFITRYDYLGNALVTGDIAYGQNVRGVVQDASGNFLLTRAASDGSGSGAYAAMYNRNGSVRLPEFRVNASITTNDQAPGAVAMNPAGYFAITFSSPGQAYLRIYNPNGTARTGEVLIPANVTGMTIDNSGIVTMVGFSCGVNGANRCDTWLRRYDSVGTLLKVISPLNIAYAYTNSVVPVIATTPTGNTVVLWDSYNKNTLQWGILGVRLNASGVVTGSEFSVTSVTNPAAQLNPVVAIREDGAFVVSFGSLYSTSSSPASNNVFARAFNADATPRGAEFIVSTLPAGAMFGTTTSISIDPSVAYNNFMVSWTVYKSATDVDVFARRYSMD